MRILIAGDTHGDRTNVASLLDHAYNNNCSKIMILGDFGYFEHIPQYPSFVKSISNEAVKSDIDIHWIKGNHDNHEMLNRLYGSNISTIAPNVIYHPNCSTWYWDGVKFGSMGGAYSIDKAQRTIGYDWWVEEEISNQDLYNSVNMGNVDILFSHDCPLNGNVSDYCDFTLNANSLENARKLQYVVDNVKPYLLFHGHFHLRYDGKGLYNENDNCVEYKIIGLSHNYDYRKQSYVLDTNEFKDIKETFKRSIH